MLEACVSVVEAIFFYLTKFVHSKLDMQIEFDLYFYLFNLFGDKKNVVATFGPKNGVASFCPKNGGASFCQVL